MPDIEKQYQSRFIDKQIGVNDKNGAHKSPVSPRRSQRGALSRRKADPYEDDPDFQKALSSFKFEDFGKALSLVDGLLRHYPEDNRLNKFREIIQEHMPEESVAYREHSAYLTLRNSIRKQRWTAAVQAADTLLESYPNVQAIIDVRRKVNSRVRKQESRTRIKLLAVITFLAMLLLTIGVVFARYLIQPTSLAEMLIPNTALTYPPHYLFSIYETDQPVGVGLSPDNQRIYVTEMGGARMVRIFDRSGNPLGSFASPETSIGERAPVYVATDGAGQVYVSDRIQHAIFIFSQDGDYIETLLGPDLTLSEYVEVHTGGQFGEDDYAYNLFKNALSIPGNSDIDPQPVPIDSPVWSPLGIRINHQNEMLLTDVSRNNNRVIQIPLGDQLSNQQWVNFAPVTSYFGKSGSGNGELLFPNSAAKDSRGRIYVSDGNNRRVSVWDSDGNFQFNFGSGIGPGSLSLPRGMIIDRHDRLYVVDAVAQNVKVYDVSGTQPIFLFEFGDFGKGDGLFNYPNDIAVDSSGRLYIADRENNRVEVWSY